MIDEYRAEFDLEPATDRVPPNDPLAEQSVLGSILTSANALGEVLDIVNADDFYQPRHMRVFEAAVDMFAAGEPVDPITIAAELEKRGTLAKAGGPVYLFDIAAGVPIAANAAHYAEIVRDKAVLRRLIEKAIKIAQLGYEGRGDANEIVDLAQAEMYSVSKGKSTEDYHVLAELLDPAFDEIGKRMNFGGGVSGVPTGFDRMDKLTHGLLGGQLVIVAARPGVGKSTLALDFARSAAIHNNMATAVFSLEMGRNEIIMRLLSAEASVRHDDISSGKLGDADFRRISDRSTAISNAPLFIDDSPNLTMNEIRSKARRLKQRHDLKLIVIDYLQLMTSGGRVRTESRQVEVSEFSRQAKLLAKELDVPVVALSQLNRNAETRQDGKPDLADLRESGSLEQDADLVILIHRPEMHQSKTRKVELAGTYTDAATERQSADRQGEADLIIAKHRGGPTGTVTVAFQKHLARFVDMSDPNNWRN
ncbi:MAG: replicative DNA helicase [Propionibacteriaceae bacterium]|jgi:replicative DNA helicase|nr:replicative DNA helicase [Propionibacteriaceae bacterium]